MGKIILGVFLLSTAALLANDKLQPLNIKTGLWETTVSSTTSGLPPITPAMRQQMAQMTPEQRARLEAAMAGMTSGKPQTRTHKNCVTKEDLAKYPFEDPDRKCTYTVLASTSSKLDVRGTCYPGSEGVKFDFKGQFEAADSEHVKGTGQLSMASGDHTMTGNYTATSKWLGATCPADTK